MNTTLLALALTCLCFAGPVRPQQGRQYGLRSARFALSRVSPACIYPTCTVCYCYPAPSRCGGNRSGRKSIETGSGGESASNTALWFGQDNTLRNL